MTINVLRASLTIAAANTNKLYGAAVPPLRAGFSGFVNGDTTNQLGSQPVPATAATTSSPVGAYSITSSGASSSNYTINYVGGTLTVAPAPLTISAVSTNKLYGAATPSLRASFSGFANGDTTNNLTSQPVLATIATAASPVGAYPITVSGAASPNYTISYIGGTLTVAKAGTAGLVSSSQNPSQPGQAVSFAFAVSPVAPGAGIPTGTVQFQIAGTNSGSPVALAGGAASYILALAPAGSYSVVARYAGDANFNGTTNTLSPVQLVNTPPVAGGGTIQRWPSNGAKVLISILLSNSLDADGDPVTFVSASTASTQGGTITRDGDWLFYLPAAGFTNDDSFTYSVADNRGATAIGTILVKIETNTVPSPNLTITDLGGGSFAIRFDGIPGRTYRIQYNQSFSNAVWNALGAATADPFGSFRFIDTPPGGSPLRFYRSVFP